MDKSSIIHYMNEMFQYKLNEHQYVIKIKVKKGDVKGINLHYVEKYLRERNIPNHQEFCVPMKKVASTRLSDYYETIISDEIEMMGKTLQMLAARYYFEFINDNKEEYYGNYKWFKEKPFNTIDMFNMVIHQLNSTFFETPEWSKGATFYQIFPERFCPTDEKYSSNWFLTPMDSKARTNGTLKGVEQKLEYIKSLGVDAIYFNPIFKSTSSHKYDTIDYMKIDEPLGTEEDFKSLIKKAHSLGIKVVLDLVFNHSSTLFFAFQDVLKNQQNSKYKDWYFINEYPVDVSWPAKFMGFSFAPFMPKLNTDNKECREYLLNVGRHYLKEFDVDGYRLDVADEVTHSFWKEFRNECKKIKKDCLIMGEVWYESTPYLRGDEFDSIMNYTIFDAIRSLLNKKITIDEFIDNIERERGESNLTYYHTSNTLIGSHDTDRIFTHLGKDKDKFISAFSLLYFLPGAPLLYYGDEIMMEGENDPDCRRGMIFDPSFNKDIKNLMVNLIDLKHKLPLKEGELYLQNKDYLEITREYENEKYILILSLDKEINLPQYNDAHNLLTNEKFQGTLKPFNPLIIKR